MSTPQTETELPHTHTVAGDSSLDAVVRFHNMRTNNTTEYVQIWTAITDPVKQTILRTIATYDGATYNDLYDVTTCTERTVRTKISELEDAQLVEKEGKPAHIMFTDDTVAVMVSDVLSAIDESGVGVV